MALTQKEKHDRFYAKPENREKRRAANRARYAAADGMVARGVRYLQRAEAVTHPDVPPLTIP